MATNLEVLRELTHQLTLADMVRKKCSDWVRYEVERGNCIGIGLLHERSCAVQKAFMSKGTVFPAHVHEEIEYLLIYEGKLELDGKQYDTGEVIRIAPGQEHIVKALEDTWMIGVTIPASTAYPDAEAAHGET